MRRVFVASVSVFSLIVSACDGGLNGATERASAALAEAGRKVAQQAAAGGAPSEPALAEAAAEPSTYYQWVDDRGSVHFEKSLDAVPADWRDRAGRVEIDPAAVRKPTPARAKPAARVAVQAVEATPSRVHDVTIYTAPWCGWCRKTIAFLDQRGIDYVNKDIEADPSYEEELREKTGRTSIPLVEIDGEQIRGFNPGQMTALLAH